MQSQSQFTNYSNEQSALFQEQGYGVIPSFLNLKEVSQLKNEIDHLVAQYDPANSLEVFQAGEKNEVRNREFLESAENITYFWENQALDDHGRPIVSKAKGLNKIGHALHDLNPVFQQMTYSEKMKNLWSSLGYSDPRIYQSMVIFKHPFIGGEVPWHQDQSYLFSPQGNVVGFWIAMEDSHRDNGCLWVIPGGHRGPLRKKFQRKGNTTETLVLDETPWKENQAIPLEVSEGTLVFFHGLLPHMSLPNRSAESRLAVTLHGMEACWEYPQENWLQRTGKISWGQFESGK